MGIGVFASLEFQGTFLPERISRADVVTCSKNVLRFFYLVVLSDQSKKNLDHWKRRPRLETLSKEGGRFCNFRAVSP